MSNSAYHVAAGWSCALLVLLGATASAGEFDDALLEIQHRWAKVNYEESGKRQKSAFDELLADARTFSAAYPGRAEALVWHGIVASSYAGVKGPFGAMSLAKEARDRLLEAEALDPDALDGSVYTSLGTLYYKVPGGIIGFGDKTLARKYLQRALEVNPNGIDPNYFYADFLFEEEDYTAARKALEKAQHAPRRPDRPLADTGRQRDIADLMQRIDRKLGRQG